MSLSVFSSRLGDVVIPGPPCIAAVDPGASNDVTAGFVPGSQWINTANTRSWLCVSNAQGAAVWAFDGAQPGSPEPSSIVTQFGGGSSSFAEEGNLTRQLSGPGINPGSTGNDNVLAVYPLPANSFDIAGRGLSITAQGSFANNTNAKRVKLVVGATTATVGSAVVGGTTIADTGSYTTTGAVGWEVAAFVFKYGASGSNTQLGMHQSAQMGSALGSLLVPTLLTMAENAAISIAVTGNAGTAVADITMNLFTINAMN